MWQMFKYHYTPLINFSQFECMPCVKIEDHMVNLQGNRYEKQNRKMENKNILIKGIDFYKWYIGSKILFN